MINWSILGVEHSKTKGIKRINDDDFVGRGNKPILEDNSVRVLGW